MSKTNDAEPAKVIEKFKKDAKKTLDKAEKKHPDLEKPLKAAVQDLGKKINALSPKLDKKKLEAELKKISDLQKKLKPLAKKSKKTELVSALSSVEQLQTACSVDATPMRAMVDTVTPYIREMGECIEIAHASFKSLSTHMTNAAFVALYKGAKRDLPATKALTADLAKAVALYEKKVAKHGKTNINNMNTKERMAAKDAAEELYNTMKGLRPKIANAASALIQNLDDDLAAFGKDPNVKKDHKGLKALVFARMSANNIHATILRPSIHKYEVIH